MQTKCTAECARTILQYQYGEKRLAKRGAIIGAIIGGVTLPAVGAIPGAAIGGVAGYTIGEKQKKEEVEHIQQEIDKRQNKKTKKQPKE